MSTGNERRMAMNPAIESKYGFSISEKRKKVWNIELEILDEFNRICEEHGLHYFFIGGSSIGVERHQGFIPWDDDLDVGMLRCDFDKFIAVARNGLKDGLFLAILEMEYPGLTLIENPYFETCNNIASLYVAREHIENAIILDGDQIIYNPNILAPEFERSGYNSVWTDEETDEWLQTVENGIVISCSRTGGKGGWQLYSISRWTEEDGKKLKHHLEIEFEQKKNRQIYWDDVAMFYYLSEYELGIQPMNSEDIIEVDDFSELVALDSSYRAVEEERLNG